MIGGGGHSQLAVNQAAKNIMCKVNLNCSSVLRSTGAKELMSFV
jgi:hypothetical protein